MLLVVDVGNTNTVMGIYDGENLLNSWRLQTHHGRTRDEHGVFFMQLFEFSQIEVKGITGAIMSCVVPPMERILVSMLEKYIGVTPHVVSHKDQVMPIRNVEPKEIGADRLVNAVAAWDKHRCAMIVVDFGTATTFDAISSDGAYLGGAICPGVTVSSEALFRAASKLPRVEIGKPEHVIGRHTVEAIQSGLLYGYTGLVRELVTRMKEELGEEAFVVATGGLARFIVSESDVIDEVDDLLTLKGLKLIWSRLSNTSS